MEENGGRRHEMDQNGCGETISSLRTTSGTQHTKKDDIQNLNS
jgi:hypothetical protein